MREINLANTQIKRFVKTVGKSSFFPETLAMQVAQMEFLISKLNESKTENERKKNFEELRKNRKQFTKLLNDYLKYYNIVLRQNIKYKNRRENHQELNRMAFHLRKLEFSKIDKILKQQRQKAER